MDEKFRKKVRIYVKTNSFINKTIYNNQKEPKSKEVLQILNPKIRVKFSQIYPTMWIKKKKER